MDILKPYMIYSRHNGPSEGAFLCFAHSWREARNVSWRSARFDITDDFLDLTARLIKGEDYLYKQANQTLLSQNIPHVIDSPITCSRCYTWGGYEIDETGYCEGCKEIINDTSNNLQISQL